MHRRFCAKLRSLPIALPVILAAAVLLRLPLLATNVGGVISDKILWYDEAYSVFFAGHGLWDVIGFSGRDTTPALFVVLLHFWMRIFGDSVLTLTALPFLLNIVSIPLVHLLAKGHFGARAGWLAALFLALNPLHIKFAAEIRTYSLTFCLAALSLIFLRRFLERRRTKDGAWWLVWAVLGMYSHYTFIFFFFLQNLYVLFRAGSGGFKEVKKWLALLAAGAAASLPLLFMFKRWGDFFDGGAGASYFSRAFGHGNALSFLTYFSSLFFGERRFYADSPAAAILTLGSGAAVLAGLALLCWRRRADRSVSFLGFLLFGGIVVFMAAGFIYDPRYYLVFVAPLAVLAASALAGIRGWRLPAALAAFILLMFLPVTGAFEVTPPLAFKYYAPSFAAHIEKQEQPGDLLLLDHYTDILFRRYYRGSSETEVFFPRSGRNVTDMFERFRYFDYDLTSSADYGVLADLTRGHDRIWTIDYYPQRTSLQDPDGLKRKWLSGRYLLRQAVEFPPGGEEPASQKTLLLLYEKE